MTELEALLALNMLPKIGPVRARRLMAKFGGAAAVLKTPPDALRRVEGVGPETARLIHEWEDHVDLSGELRRINELGLDVVTEEREEYPRALRELHDAPLVLYARGKLLPRDRLAIGVVGSRRATSYGLSAAKKLSFQLALAGVTVLSGLARGIDTAAHEGAVAAKGRTVAVLGSGLGRLYPPENAALAERIADGHGAVISEFPILTEPDKQTFPQRNRIVSGWSQGVLVVEAPAWSGALITAHNAADQGRAVYAVPGPIDRPTSLGCNKLIQNGARLVMDAQDVLDELNLLIPDAGEVLKRDAEDLFGWKGGEANGEKAPAPAGDGPERIPPALSPEELALWKALGNEERHIDELIQASGLSASEAFSNLMRLELKKLVRQLPGRIFARLV